MLTQVAKFIGYRILASPVLLSAVVFLLIGVFFARDLSGLLVWLVFIVAVLLIDHFGFKSRLRKAYIPWARQYAARVKTKAAWPDLVDDLSLSQTNARGEFRRPRITRIEVSDGD